MENQEIKTRKPITKTVGFHFFTVGFLVLVLMIPMTYVMNLIGERSSRKNEVAKSLSKEWGGKTYIYGPVLKIPYKTYNEQISFSSEGKRMVNEVYKGTEYLYVFPEKLKFNGNAKTEKKHRAIYEFPVYKLESQISGTFKLPDFKKYKVPLINVDFDNIKLLILTNNIKGINKKPVLKLNDSTFSFTSGDDRIQGYYKNQEVYEYRNYPSEFTFASLQSDRLMIKPENLDKEIDFQFDFNFKGSNSIQFLPVGKESIFHLKSNWKDPKFSGSFLPDNKDKLKSDGFDAHWKVIDFQRTFGQVSHKLQNINAYMFGVYFFQPIDEYKQNDRASKYGFLVIFLTFIIFFILQNIGKVNMHIFNYFLIGLALVIFYTLLLSISEHFGFKTAYLIASVATVLLITFYSKSILHNKKFVRFIFASLSALYGFIYVIIQLENYALLVGSVGLFIILAMIMYASRKIEWGK